MKIEEIKKLIDSDIDAAFDVLDGVFDDNNGTYNDLCKEYVQRPNNFDMGTFRSKMKRFVTTSKIYIEGHFRENNERKENKLEDASKKGIISTLVGDFIFVKGSTFKMGDEYGDLWDACRPVHDVKVSDFYIGKTQVTQKQWRDVMGKDPDDLYFKGNDNNPVEGVNWEDVMVFINALNKKTGHIFRMPTEAEWEYAARGGVKALQGETHKYAGSDHINEVAVYESNSGKSTQPVAGKKPNELGIYDMCGNVWEWCEDWFNENYYKECKEKGIVKNPNGPASGSYGVVRGGSWGNLARSCRAAYRLSILPGGRGNGIGFRLVFVP